MKRIATIAGLVLLTATSAAIAQGTYTKADFRAGVPAPPVVDGGDCATPTGVGPLPFMDSGTTVGETSSVGTIPIGCNGNYTTVAGEDVIYTFTTNGGTGNLTFDVVTSSADYDPSIYVLGTCDDGSDCIIGADDCFAQNAGGNPCGALSDESIPATAFADGTYFFYVDSFYAEGGQRSAGPFDLTIDGTIPVELVGFEID